MIDYLYNKAVTAKFASETMVKQTKQEVKQQMKATGKPVSTANDKVVKAEAKKIQRKKIEIGEKVVNSSVNGASEIGTTITHRQYDENNKKR